MSTSDEDQLCQLCGEYYRNNDLYCSNCNLEVEHGDQYLTYEEILQLQTSIFKGDRLQEHLGRIFDDFCTDNGCTFVVVNSPNMFTMVLNACQNKNKHQLLTVLKTMFGVPCLLKAKYAQELLRTIVGEDNQGLRFDLEHVIKHFIYDPWNCNFDSYCLDNGHICMVADFPLNLEQIHANWQRTIAFIDN
jgi:hypothetical protein